MRFPENKNFTLRIATKKREIDITSQEWNALASDCETNTIFQTYEWFHSWWDIFGESYQLYFIAIYENQDLAGIAPLMISGHSSRKTLQFVGNGKSDYCDFLIRTQKEAILFTLFDHIFQNIHKWDYICLNNIPKSSSSVEILAKICESYRCRFITGNLYQCPTLVMKGFEKETVDLINKPSLKRRYNYFSKSGRLSFVNITNQKEAQELLDIFFQQHIKRWDKRGMSSLFLNTKNRDFYRELTRNMLAKGWLLFSMLEYNDKPIAFHFGFDYNSRVIWYKPSFDIDYFKHSPGKVLLRFLIEFALSNGNSELDFTLGDEPFKQEFSNQTRTNLYLKIFKRKLDYHIVVFYYRMRLKTRWVTKIFAVQ